MADVKTYKVHEVNRQLKITLPRVLAQALGIKAGDKITYSIDRGELVLRKAE